MLDFDKLRGKKIEVVRYKLGRDNIRHSGVFVEQSGHYLILVNSNGREMWVWNPGRMGRVREI